MTDIQQLFPNLDPTIINKYFGQARAWIAVAVALGFAVPNIPDNTLKGYVATAVIGWGLIASVWSYYEKKKHEAKALSLVIDSSVESARTGKPVVVDVTTTTPPGQPNIGYSIPIPLATQANATIVTTTDLNLAEIRNH